MKLMKKSVRGKNNSITATARPKIQSVMFCARLRQQKQHRIIANHSAGETVMPQYTKRTTVFLQRSLGLCGVFSKTKLPATKKLNEVLITEN